MLKVLRICSLTEHWDFCGQDVRAITLFKSLWPTYPSLSVLWSSYEGRTGGQIRCSPSSVWKRSSRSGNAAGLYEMSIFVERGIWYLPLRHGENVTDMDEACCRHGENVTDMDEACCSSFRRSTDN